MLRPSDNPWNRQFARNFLLCGLLLLLAQLPVFADQSVVLTWNPSPDANVAGYKIYYGGASLTYTNSVLPGNVTNVTILGLTEGATYYFAATTVDAAGDESEFSNEAIYSIPLAVSNPPAPVAPPPEVNVPPSLNAVTNLTIFQNAGWQTVWLTGITTGSANQSQPLTVSAVSSNPSVISTPVVNYTSPDNSGTLTFAPAANALGTATVTVTVNNGGASNNLITQTFAVTVVAAPVVNQPPTLNPIANVTVGQNVGAQLITLTGITSGSPTEKQVLSVSASSSNPALVPVPVIRYLSPASTAQLIFRPVPNASGLATITVTVDDGGKSNNLVQQTFTVTVLPNQPPTLNPIANVTVAQNAGGQLITLTGITSGSPAERQVLTVRATSSNPLLVPSPAIRYSSPASTAQLVFHPVAKASGVATITVTVNDGGKTNNLVQQSFTVTVTSPVTSPSISALKSVVSTNLAARLTTVASPKGQFSFQVNGVTGGQYVVQATSDLIHWTAVQTNTAPFTFQDPAASGASQRFYRTYYVQ